MNSLKTIIIRDRALLAALGFMLGVSCAMALLASGAFDFVAAMLLIVVHGTAAGWVGAAHIETLNLYRHMGVSGK